MIPEVLYKAIAVPESKSQSHTSPGKHKNDTEDFLIDGFIETAVQPRVVSDIV